MDISSAEFNCLQKDLTTDQFKEVVALFFGDEDLGWGSRRSKHVNAAQSRFTEISFEVGSDKPVRIAINAEPNNFRKPSSQIVIRTDTFANAKRELAILAEEFRKLALVEL